MQNTVYNNDNYDIYSAPPPVVRAVEIQNGKKMKNGFRTPILKRMKMIIRTVDELRAVVYNLLDLAFLGEVADGNTGKGSVDFKTLDKDGLGDETEGWDFLKDTVVGSLVEDNSVLCLVLYLALGPFLLSLCLSSRGCCYFSFGL